MLDRPKRKGTKGKGTKGKGTKGKGKVKVGRRGDNLKTTNGVQSKDKFSPGKSSIDGFYSDYVICFPMDLDNVDVFNDEITISQDSDSSYSDSEDRSDSSLPLNVVDPLIPDPSNLRSTSNSQR